MSDFRKSMEKRGEALIGKFINPTINQYSHRHQKDEWMRFIQQQAIVDVRADLTMKQSANFYTPSVGGSLSQVNRVALTEALASVNLHQFQELLNYAVYKHAFKRYGKRLCVVSVLQGHQQSGHKIRQNDLRENMPADNEYKRLHYHLLLEQPSHFTFDDFATEIRRCWRKTHFGYREDKIEPIRNLFGATSYNLESGVDTIDLDNTYLESKRRATSDVSASV